jgi:hypothetical protein
MIRRTVMTDREQLLSDLAQAPDSIIDQVRQMLQQIDQLELSNRPTIGDRVPRQDMELPPAILELRRLRNLSPPFPEDFNPDAAKWAYLREKHNL